MQSQDDPPRETSNGSNFHQRYLISPIATDFGRQLELGTLPNQSVLRVEPPRFLKSESFDASTLAASKAAFRPDQPHTSSQP